MTYHSVQLGLKFLYQAHTDNAGQRIHAARQNRLVKIKKTYIFFVNICVFVCIYYCEGCVGREPMLLLSHHP